MMTEQILAAANWLRRNPGHTLATVVASLQKRFGLSTAAELQAAILLAGRRAGR